MLGDQVQGLTSATPVGPHLKVRHRTGPGLCAASSCFGNKVTLLAKGNSGYWRSLGDNACSAYLTSDGWGVGRNLFQPNQEQRPAVMVILYGGWL